MLHFEFQQVQTVLPKTTSQSEWNKAARRYLESRKTDLAWTHALEPFLASQVATRAFGMALDVGTGCGDVAAHLKPFSEKVIGIDWSPDMIAIARDRFAEIRFEISPADNMMMLEDASVDFVTAVNLLTDVPDLSGLFSEINRIAKTGAELVCVFEHPLRTCRVDRAFEMTDLPAHARGATHYYCDEFDFVSSFLGNDVPIVGRHRPLQTYLDVAEAHGLSMQSLNEICFPKGCDQSVLAKAVERELVNIPIFVCISFIVN